MWSGPVGDLVAAVLPGRCPGCGARAEPVCGACAAGLRPPLPAPPPLGVDAWAAAFAYEGVVRELVARLKYRNARSALPWLAGAAADAALRKLGGGSDAVRRGAAFGDVVTWVPTTALRRRDRGFDHGALLARAVARRLGLPARHLVVRLDGSPQTGRAASERRAGPRCVARRPVDGLRAVLVDDVATTGATLSAAARALRGAGAAQVVAVTVCRTPPPRR